MYIFSNSVNTNRGPSKVIKNLTLGLNLLNVNYRVNDMNFNNEDKLYCQDTHSFLYSGYIQRMIIGPNISILPFENYVVMEQKYKKIIVPSEWVKNLYEKWINENKIAIWGVGVDTDCFKDVKNENKTIDCLIYFKNRSESELNFIINLLKDFKQSYVVLTYGNYTEIDFLTKIKNSRYCFLLNNTESQGIAILEMMSSNLPMFVYDKSVWEYKNIQVESTAVPYWSEICGEKIVDLNDIKDKFSYFLNNINNYNPRNYILENFKLDIAAKKFIDLF